MLLNAFLLALREIRRNVLRSILTILGIVIGVASVIAMVMLGDSTTASVTEGISKLGSNMLTLSPGKGGHGPREAAKPFDIDDVKAIKREIGNLKAIAPVSSSSATVVYGNENHSTTIYGSNNDYFITKDWEFAEGEKFSQSDLNSGKSVCIIGETVRKEVFGSISPIGMKIRLGSFSCKIIGVLKAKGTASFGMDQDDVVVVPIKMLQRRVTGSQDISSISVSVKDGFSTDTVTENLRVLFRERRGIKDGSDDDFNIRDMKDIIKTLSSTTQMLTMLLGAVAAISLIVGGIGIMNIMLVSVTERTREIGIRLAIGAFEREVLMQFLVESVVLASLGGVVGIILGLLITVGVTSAFDLPFILNKGIILLSFVFSTVIGVVFGFFPAKKAANLNPIDALRHE